MFVVKLFSRSFLVKDPSVSFIVKETSKGIQKGQEIDVQVIDLRSDLPKIISGKVVAKNCLKNKILITKYKRRKAYLVKRGYKQDTVYFNLKI